MLETEHTIPLSPQQAWNSFADSYLKAVDGLNPNNGKGKRLRELVLYPHTSQIMGNLTGKEVLDAGTGEGSIARLALHKNAKRVTGIDISVPLIRQAQKRSNNREHLVEGDLNDLGIDRHLPFSKNSFDLVTCSLVLMWIPNIDGLGAEFARVLRPEGRAIITILNPLVNKPSEEGYKTIDHYAGPFPYFYRTVADYKETLQQPSTTDSCFNLKLIKTSYIRPSLDLIMHDPKVVSRAIFPEFITFVLTSQKTPSQRYPTPYSNSPTLVSPTTVFSR